MGDLISKSALLNEMKKHCGSQRHLIPEGIWEMVENFPECSFSEKDIQIKQSKDFKRIDGYGQKIDWGNENDN